MKYSEAKEMIKDLYNSKDKLNFLKLERDFSTEVIETLKVISKAEMSRGKNISDLQKYSYKYL